MLHTERVSVMLHVQKARDVACVESVSVVVYVESS